MRWFLISLAGVAFVAFLFLRLPSEILLNPLGYSQAVYSKNGELLRVTLSSDEKYRLWVPLRKISPSMISATLAQEDRWFYVHPGVNPFSIVRATFVNMFTRRRLGASTITMQVARMRFGIRSRTIVGKLEQIFQALLLELQFSKNEILEAYLNLAPYGGNIEGVGAASLIYFEKEPEFLSIAESVTLSVVPQNPTKRMLHAVRDREGFEEARGALRTKLGSKNVGEIRGVEALREKLPFRAAHLVQRLIKEDSTSGRIVSSVDLELQTNIERIINQFLERRGKVGIRNATVLLVEASTMKARAYIGSGDYWSADIQGQVDGLQGRRSPGSALKPFVYALALDEGLIHPGSVLKDTVFSRASYNPENFDHEFLGPISATEALIRSRNVPAVSLLNQLSPPRFLKLLADANVGNLRALDFYGLSLALGGVEVRADELAQLYATLANGGKWEKIRYREDVAQAWETKQLFSPEAAFLTLQMLRENPRPAHMFDSMNAPRLHRLPWKTGTSFGFRDAWSAGVIGDYVLVVWVGNFDGGSNPAFIGRDTAGPLFFRIADTLIEAKGLTERWATFQKRVKTVRVCSVSGELPGPNCSSTKESWFIPGKSPIHTCSVHRTVEIDPTTGLRLCAASLRSSRSEVFEFWSSDLQKLFRQAGLPRRKPPEYSPECRSGDPAGQPPLIASPQSGVEYVLNSEHPSIPLTAVLDGASRRAYWFIDDESFGITESAESKMWTPTPGQYLVRVVDDQGRANSVEVRVRSEA